MAEIDVPSGSSRTFVTLNAGDVMKVYGVAQGTTINSGAQQIVEAGGTVDNDTVHGGTVEIDAGGRASFTNLFDGGVQHILAGGSANATYLTNSTQYLDAGASDNYVNVYEGGVDHISGSSHGITIQAGGLVDLTQAGYASGATLSDPGQAPTSYVGDITIQGGELRIEAGVPSAVTLQSGRITLPFLHYDASVTSSYDSSGGGGLTITGDTGSYELALYAPRDGDSFIVSGNAAGETVVTVSAHPLCFCAGTLIATPEGQRAVETLAPGDEVLNASGDVRIVRWIGSGTEIATPARRPVLVRRNALADGVPFADLRVTPGHSILVDGLLIPIEALANGRSILPDESARIVRYFHVELDEHELLVANGAPAESYRDDGNRRAFSRTSGAPAAAKSPCAPLASEGPAVDRAWTRLSRRAPAPAMALSDEPQVRLLVGGSLIKAYAIEGERHIFVLPCATNEVGIVSLASVPADLGLCRDHRRLGVAVRACEIATGGHSRRHACDDPVFAEGFHEPERAAGFRWTNGDARLRWAQALAAGTRVTIEVGCRTRYVVATPLAVAV